MYVKENNNDVVKSLDANQRRFWEASKHFNFGNNFNAQIVNRYSPCFRFRWLHLKVVEHMHASALHKATCNKCSHIAAQTLEGQAVWLLNARAKRLLLYNIIHRQALWSPRFMSTSGSLHYHYISVNSKKQTVMTYFVTALDMLSRIENCRFCF